jgi:hypothetical protein
MMTGDELATQLVDTTDEGGFFAVIVALSEVKDPNMYGAATRSVPGIPR